MKEKSFTRNRSGGWFTNIGRVVVLVLFAWGFTLNANAQFTVTVECPGDIAGALAGAVDVSMITPPTCADLSVPAVTLTGTTALQAGESDPTCSGSVVYDVEVQFECLGGVITTDDVSVTVTVTGDITPDEVAPVILPSVMCPPAVMPGQNPPVNDNCGRPITYTNSQVSAIPICAGNIVYTWDYEYCSGITGVYTVTLPITGDVTANEVPGNMTLAAVECAADAVAPASPGDITDQCGNTVSPTGPVISAAPTCAGEITYTWTYTYCNSNAIGTTVKTIPITGDITTNEIPVDVVIPVMCLSEAVQPTPPTVTDNCGNAVDVALTSTTNDPPCNGGPGTKDYVFTYTYCSSTMAIPVMGTYMVRYTINDLTPPTVTCPTAPIILPFNPTTCVYDAVSIAANTLGSAMDNCGSVMSVSHAQIDVACGDVGTLTVDFTATDCRGNTSAVTQCDITLEADPAAMTFTQPDPICIGSTTTLSVSPTCGTFTGSNVNAAGVFTAPSIPGSYAVTYCIGATGCEVCVTRNIQVLDGLTVTTSTTDENCDKTDGTATATSSGTAPFTYAWSSGGTGMTASGLASGSYIVTVTDANGCTGEATVIVTDAPALSVSIATGDNSNCAPVAGNGVATATPTNGTAPYTYAWSNSGTGSSQTGLSSGAISVTVTDANGCTAIDSDNVAQAANTLTASVTTTPDMSCGIGTANGSVTATVNGGSGDYSYSWTGSVNTNPVPNLAGGTYEVTITDNTTGCTVIASGAVATSNDCGQVAMGSAFAGVDTDMDCEFGEGGSEVLPTPFVIAPGAPVTFTDDGGSNLDYLENTGRRAWTICASDPMMQRIRITFSRWNVDEADEFVIYEGRLTDVNDDDWITCEEQIASHAPIGEVGVDAAPNGGWVEAGCETDGCLTIVFKPNNDGVHGEGWVFNATANPISFDADAPANVTLSGDCGNPAGSWYTIPEISISGCSQGLSVRTTGGNVAGDNIRVFNGDVIGYEIFKTSNNSLVQSIGTQTITVNPAVLVCNTNVNVALDPIACAVNITPDMILEGECTANASNVRLNGQVTLELSEVGSHTISVSNGASVCSGTITIQDITGPVCTGIDTDADDDAATCFQSNVICADFDAENTDALFPSVQASFTDCSEIVDTRYTDMVLGDGCSMDTNGDGVVNEDDFASLGGRGFYFRLLKALARAIGAEVAETPDGTLVLVLPGTPAGSAGNGDGVTIGGPITIGDDTTPGTGSGASVGNGFISIDGRSSLSTSRGGPDDAPVICSDPFNSMVMDGLSFTLVNAVKRTYQAEDAHGNVGSCDDLFVFIWKPNNLFLPATETIECTDGDATSAGGPVFYWDKDGDGDLEQYSATTACKYSVNSTDQSALSDAACEQKTIRKYDVIDWCTGAFMELIAPVFLPNGKLDLTNTTATDRQLVKVIDTEAPNITCVAIGDAGGALNPHYFSVGDACAITPSIIAPDVSDACHDASAIMLSVHVVDSVGIDSTIHLGDRLGNNLGATGDLECGFYAITYAAIDDCGNMSDEDDNCMVFFTINDDLQPSVICSPKLNVTLNDSGSATIVASLIDVGSNDNCGVTSTLLRIMDKDDDFAASITVSCDLKPGTMIEVQVADAKGNSNYCWSELMIEDKVAPTVSAPADATGTCNEYHSNVFVEGEVTDADLMAYLNSSFGTPTSTDNCGIVSTTQSLAIDNTSCGSFTVTRTFTVEDWGGKTASADQTITITSVSDWTLNFPADVELDCGDDIPLALSASDIISEVGFCDRLSVHVEEFEFFGESDACVKVLRRYVVWNECATSGGQFFTNGSQGDVTVTEADANVSYIIHEQVLKANITEGPIITIGEIEEGLGIVGSVDKDGSVCGEEKTFEVWAGDCLENDIPESGLTVIITGPGGDTLSTVNEYNTFEDDQDFLTLKGRVEPGTYTVEVWAADGCGNSTGATQSFTFVDAKAPAIWVLNGIATEIMPSNGQIDIWASDFINGLGDCDPSVTADNAGIWHTSMGAAPADCDEAAALGQSVVFGCDYIGTQLVRIYATDSNGNCDYVETYIIIQDNNGTCGGDSGGALPRESQVAGRVINTSGDLVEKVNVAVNGTMSDAMTTSAAGTYAFTLENGGDYTITPEKDTFPLNGVSTYDLVLISRHILEDQKFDTPYQYIAADVNNNGRVTTFDLVLLRRLILKIDSEFADNTSWRFIDAGYDFGNDVTTTLSQNFPEIMNLNNLIGDKLDNDFIGVKIGDINGSAVPNSLVSTDVRNAAGTLVLTTSDRFVEAGESVEVAFSAADIASVTGYQFTMNYAGLQFAELVEGVAKANNFNTNLRGAIATSWNGDATANAELFTVNFTANTSGALSELLSVSSDIATAEAYNEAGEVLDIALEFTGTATQAAFDLAQNSPNPFKGETVIGFTLPQAGTATLKVMDAQGKVVKLIEGDYTKGFNQISLNAKELGATGVLHYQLESAEHTATRKMIIIE